MIYQKQLEAAKPVILGLFILLLLGAFIFYKQRFLFADDAHILFRIINEGSLQIPGKRYGSFISQLLPLEGALLLLPLRIIMLLYSLSFILFYSIVLLLLINTFGRYDLGILFSFCLTLFVSGTFYWPYNEMPQGVAWLLLGIALPEYFIKKNKPFLFSFLLFFLFFSLAIWSHPLLIIIALYLFLFFAINGVLNFLNKGQLISLIVAIAVAIWLRTYVISRDNYDSNLLAPFLKLHFYEIPGVFLNTHACYFIKNCFTSYWVFTIVFCCGIYGMIKAKKYVSLILSLFFFLCYFLVICVTYPGLTESFFVESEYVPFVFFASIPFIYFFLPLLAKKNIIMLLSALFFVRIIYIMLAAPFFINRVTVLEHVLDKMRINNYYKAVIVDENNLNNEMRMTWGTPEESIILSALQNEHPQRTFVIMSQAEIKQITLPGKDTLLGCFEKRPFSRLNPHYFQMDTSDVYHIMELNATGTNYKTINYTERR